MKLKHLIKKKYSTLKRNIPHLKESSLIFPFPVPWIKDSRTKLIAFLFRTFYRTESIVR